MNLGMSEMVFIFLLALIIFGPRKLPEIGREIGKALAELKRASNEFKSQLESEIEQVNVEEERKKFRDKAQELMQEAQGGFSIMPPEHSGVARSLGQAGVKHEELNATLPMETAGDEMPNPGGEPPHSDVKASNVQ